MEAKILQEEGLLTTYGIYEYIQLMDMFIILRQSIKEIMSIIYSLGDMGLHYIISRLYKTQLWLEGHLETTSNHKLSWQFLKKNVKVLTSSLKVHVHLVLLALF